MILDTHHLQMIREVYERGTLTAAARALFISQPALSRKLDKLERRLGTRLFHRHAAGMSLTREGHRLLLAAERVLGEMERAEHDVKLLARGHVGTLRVSTECYMCYHWLPGVARAFGARFPRVELQLVPAATSDPFGALERAVVDVALVYSVPPQPSPVDKVPAFEDELVAVLSRQHPLADRAFLAPDDLRDETLLCHYAEPGRGVLEAEFLEPAGVRPRQTMELLVTPAVVEMARAGYGVAVVPGWIIPSLGTFDGLVRVRLGENGLHRTWHLAYLALRRDEPVLASFLGTLQEQLGAKRLDRDDSTRSRLQTA